MAGCYIYCLYSTEDGVPRYIGKASDKVSYRFRQHITAALEREPGAVYDWMRDVWRRDGDVSAFTLQYGIPPVDLTMYEQYWIDQFGGLVNAAGNRPGRVNTALADQITAAIKATLADADRDGG